MLKDILKREGIPQHLVSVSRETTIQEAAQCMEEENVGALLVLEDGKPVGILTDRDIVLRCVSGGEVDAKTCKVGDIMTESPESCKDTDGFFDIIKKMQSQGVRRIPIVDESGKAIGILSSLDIMRVLAKELDMLTAGVAPDVYLKGKGAPHTYPEGGKIKKAA